jgi:hypothetical protein
MELFAARAPMLRDVGTPAVAIAAALLLYVVVGHGLHERPDSRSAVHGLGVCLVLFTVVAVLALPRGPNGMQPTRRNPRRRFGRRGVCRSIARRPTARLAGLAAALPELTAVKRRCAADVVRFHPIRRVT